MNARYLPLTAALLAVNLSGCGSIIATAKQDFTVQTSDPATYATTRCTLKNQSGQWIVPPGITTSIDRDRHNLAVACENAQEAGATTVGYKGNVWPFFGNIGLLGFFAPVGWMIDFGNDADCEYPDFAMVPLAPKTVAAVKPRTAPRTVAVR